MREFSTQISSALFNGIKPFTVREDNAFLHDLKGFLPFEQGLRPHVPLVKVVDIEGEYPFPQLFDLEKGKILLTKDQLYAVDSSFSPFELLQVQVSEWDLNSFSERYFASSYDDQFFLLSPEGCLWGNTSVVNSSPKVKGEVILKHRNRTLMGGMQDGFWPEHILHKLRNEIQEDLPLDIPESAVIWSSYESLDFPFGLVDEDEFVPHLSLTEWFETHEFGWIDMPWEEPVINIVPIGDDLIVFSKGHAAIIRESGESPGAGYGIVQELDYGLLSKHSVGYAEGQVLFIDDSYNLRLVTSEGMRKLDFRMEMLKLSTNTYITKSKTEDVWYVGDDKISFVLIENQKLARINQTVAWSSEDDQYAHCFQTSVNSGYVLTLPLDIGIVGLKTLTGISLGTDNHVHKNAHVQVLAEVRGNEVSGPIVPLNFEGYAACRTFGKNHRVQIFFDSVENVHIDYLELKWQIDDNRYRRGTYATQDTA